MKKYFGTFIFGAIAMGAMLLALAFPHFSPFLLMLALPAWLLFVIVLVRALKP